jgi:hypothetical protein
MQTHELRSWPECFLAISEGKPFDIRYNDRRFAAGDEITFREYDDRKGTYTGSKCFRKITHVADNPMGSGAIPPLRGLCRGYAILGLQQMEKPDVVIGRPTPGASDGSDTAVPRAAAVSVS